MKKQTLILMMTVITAFEVNAQKVDTCNGNTSKVIIDADDALYFNLQGLNLNSYDWTNPNINCNINLMLVNYHSSKNFGTLGWILIGVGASGLGSAIALSSYGSDSVAPIYLVSLGGIAGGIGFLVKASKEKKSMNFHMNTVSQYYRDRGLQ